MTIHVWDVMNASGDQIGVVTTGEKSQAKAAAKAKFRLAIPDQYQFAFQVKYNCKREV